MKYNKDGIKYRLCAISNKGITLIALIVTIVVLLILAGISIASITGNDAPMEKAGHAKNETEIQAEMEEIQDTITKGGSKNFLHGDFSGSADTTSIKTALKGKNLINENPDDVIIEGINGWKVTGKKTGQTYKIMPNGELKRIELIGVTDIYGKLYSNGTLILSSKDSTTYTDYDPSATNITLTTDYGKSKKWNSSNIKKVVIYDKIAPSTCSGMFKDCTNLLEIENVENLHTENVTSMYEMFRNCQKLTTIDLTHFDTSNVTSMMWMFFNCYVLDNLNFNNFDTSNVKSMYGMFYSCGFETLDLSMFNTYSVNNMLNMFYNNKTIKKIYVSNNFNVDKVTSSENMFSNCSKLVGGSGTTYNSEHLDKEYAHIDGGSSNPGYFTQK